MIDSLNGAERVTLARVEPSIPFCSQSRSVPKSERRHMHIKGVTYRQERTIFARGGARLRIRVNRTLRGLVLKLARMLRGY